MNVSELLAKFSDPHIIKSLSITEKMSAGFVTVILGMGITFFALILLQFIITWMNTLLNSKADKSPASVPRPSGTVTENEIQSADDDTELIAVISSVIAMKTATSVDNIIIRNIEKVEKSTSPWSLAGITDLMNSRL